MDDPDLTRQYMEFTTTVKFLTRVQLRLPYVVRNSFLTGTRGFCDGPATNEDGIGPAAASDGSAVATGTSGDAAGVFDVESGMGGSTNSLRSRGASRPASVRSRGTTRGRGGTTASGGSVGAGSGSAGPSHRRASSAMSTADAGQALESEWFDWNRVGPISAAAAMHRECAFLEISANVGGVAPTCVRVLVVPGGWVLMFGCVTCCSLPR